MATIWLLAALVAGPLMAETVGTLGGPQYSAESIANTAAGVAGFYAPNTFVSIYGQNLSDSTHPIGPNDIAAGLLPTIFTGSGARVLVNNVFADLYYVSPTQVNLLLPASLTATSTTLQLARDGFAGPEIVLHLTTAAPALFQIDGQTVIATHGNGPLVTAASPATRGETLVLYASGLGPTLPPAPQNRLATEAAQLANIGDFRVWLNGTPVDPKRVLYAGLTPGFAGLYQINVQLPDDAPANPEIRVGYTDLRSPAGRILPVQ